MKTEIFYIAYVDVQNRNGSTYRYYAEDAGGLIRTTNKFQAFRFTPDETEAQEAAYCMKVAFSSHGQIQAFGALHIELRTLECQQQ